MDTATENVGKNAIALVATNTNLPQKTLIKKQQLSEKKLFYLYQGKNDIEMQKQMRIM